MSSETNLSVPCEKSKISLINGALIQYFITNTAITNIIRAAKPNSQCKTKAEEFAA